MTKPVGSHKSCYLPPPDVFERMLELDAEGHSYEAIAAAVGVCAQTVGINIRAYNDPVPEAVPSREWNDPTPTEIRKRCLEIQKGWTPRERKRRAGLDPHAPDWSVPLSKLHGVERKREDAA